MTELNLGAKVAWIWGPSNLVTLIWIVFFLPESEGRTLEGERTRIHLECGQTRTLTRASCRRNGQAVRQQGTDAQV